MQTTLKIVANEDKLRAYLPRELDHHAARPIREVLDRRLFEEKPTVLILDFSGVEFMDSSAIALIIGRASACESLGAAVILTGLSEHQKKLVRLSGALRTKNVSITEV
ncbi:MAG: anti-sigma factor antagonist [Clostridia bacterium]|nr:anti-sigma factor antagonist [Clostridia bacterium]